MIQQPSDMVPGEPERDNEHAPQFPGECAVEPERLAAEPANKPELVALPSKRPD